MICRACKNEGTKELLLSSYNNFKYLFIYTHRSRNSKCFYCSDCGSLSFYQDLATDYKGGGYRRKNESVNPPIDLPWSTITYKRHEHICEIIGNHFTKIRTTDNNYLDFGGYNGFGAYGICKKLGLLTSNTYVADMDPNGLSIARSLGFNTLDLSTSNLNNLLKTTKKIYSLITAVHVLEHLEDPSSFFKYILPYVDENSLVYVEVPSRFFFPLADPSHLITFSDHSMIKLAKDNGFKIVCKKTVSTPKESILYGYPLSSRFESYSFVFKKSNNSYIISDESDNFYESRYAFLFKLSSSNFILRFIILVNYLSISFFYIFKILKSLIFLPITAISSALPFIVNILKKY